LQLALPVTADDVRRLIGQRRVVDLRRRIPRLGWPRRRIDPWRFALWIALWRSALWIALWRPRLGIALRRLARIRTGRTGFVALWGIRVDRA
ncbi:MAG: hypothetical protein M3619_09520, partial [Myxococcota bacterium]|nr:hypothetical protein [Myxococcota bacterium]